MVQNPILRGFHPDPSLLRVGDDYYLATSTFEWAPGVRIYHSTDLKHWDYVTSPLDDYSRMDLRGLKASDGIWAPCLSWDGEYFYLIYTVVRDAREYAQLPDSREEAHRFLVRSGLLKFQRFRPLPLS